ncbi:hypothetical protein P7C70_g6265, partial [Phenoliferia sp. Uapishka_3]
MPSSHVSSLPAAPGQRLCLSILTRYLSDLQSCCAATSQCFPSSPTLPIQVDNLAAHPAVRVVFEEARRKEAEDVMERIRGSVIGGNGVGVADRWYPYQEGVTHSVFEGPSQGNPRVEATLQPRGDASNEPQPGTPSSNSGEPTTSPRTFGPLPSVADILSGMPFTATLPVRRKPISDDYFTRPIKPQASEPPRSQPGDSLPWMNLQAHPATKQRPMPPYSNQENSARALRIIDTGAQSTEVATTPRASSPSPPVKSPGATRLSPVDRPGSPDALQLPPARMRFASLLNT